MENRKNLVNVNRIKEEFAELVAIDSVTYEEREMADRLTEKLKAIGFEVTEDKAGTHYGSPTGNLYGFLKGSLPGKPILLSGHMDTVQPGRGKKAIFHEDGKITSTGETVLGSDDLSGVVEILEGIRCVQEAGIPHRDIEVLFAIGEEAFLKGSAVFDYSCIRAEESYTLDMSGPIGSAALQAPTIISFKAVMHGKASHAGFEPEKGIHAIAIMSKAIAAISQGRLDDRTTLNIGTINGGEALNIVPEICTCTGEIRSYDHEKALACVASVKRIFEEKAKEGGATAEFSWVIDMNAYETPADSPVVRRFQQACQQLGLKAELTRTFGGSDNNHFVKNGLNGIVLSCGMYQVHSTEEYTLVEDMVTGAALVTALIDH